MTANLIRPLFDGPLDILGDIHGEIEALLCLLRRLGYAADGAHPEGRRLIFVGDLLDRGPDSPAVIAFVRRLVESERGQCVLGNHELNLLLGRHKPDNVWFFHHQLPVGDSAAARPQVRIEASRRQAFLDFFAELPLALERPDVRVIHACWDEVAIELVRQARDVVKLHNESDGWIESEIRQHGLSVQQAKLARQNENPVKLLTSGPEMASKEPIEVNGKLRHERRVAWWNEYEGPLCVFGHYWRISLTHENDERLFDSIPLNAALGRGDAACIDYSVGKRYLERAAPGFAGTYRTRLAALRVPERVLVFDDGSRLRLD